MPFISYFRTNSLFDEFRIFVYMNKRIISSLILLLVSAILFAQPTALNQTDKTGKKQGKWIKKDEHGRPVYEGTFKDNKPVGEFKYFYDTGELKTSSVFSTDGICRSKHYFPGNILMAEGNYVKEKRDSIWKFYNAPNSLVSEESFKKGKKDGPEKNFNGKGKLIEEKMWKDSILNGPWKKYYEDGNVQQEGVYVGGFLDGDMKFYYPNKVPAAVGHYQHSLKSGKWMYYDRSGKIVTQTENYYLDNLNGYFAQWSEKDGAPIVKGAYKQGQKHDKWTFFNEKGKLEKDSTFNIGYIHGVCSEYFENGSKKKECNYYFSHPTGKWTEWDATGKVLKEEVKDAVDVIKVKMLKEERERERAEGEKAKEKREAGMPPRRK